MGFEGLRPPYLVIINNNSLVARWKCNVLSDKLHCNLTSPKMATADAAAPELLNDLLCNVIQCDDCSAECICEVNQEPCTSECARGTSLPEIHVDEDSILFIYKGVERSMFCGTISSLLDLIQRYYNRELTVVESLFGLRDKY